jgi:hypothetical protein
MESHEWKRIDHVQSLFRYGSDHSFLKNDRHEVHA